MRKSYQRIDFMFATFFMVLAILALPLSPAVAERTSKRLEPQPIPTLVRWPTPIRNSPPDLLPVGRYEVSENNLLSFQITATDPDKNNTLRFGAHNLPQGASFVDNGGRTGTFSWTPNFDQAGLYKSIYFTVTDGVYTDTEYTYITVLNVNRSPVLDPVGDKSVNEGERLTFQVTATDPDPGDLLIFSGAHLPRGSTFDPITHLVSWRPDFDQSGVYSGVTFVVSDLRASSSVQFDITVINVNQDPIINPFIPAQVQEGDTLTVRLSATDPDSDALAWMAVGIPLKAKFIDLGGGIAEFSWTPTRADIGQHSVNVQVSDGLVTVSEALLIEVTEHVIQVDTPILDLLPAVVNQSLVMANWSVGSAENIKYYELTLARDVGFTQVVEIHFPQKSPLGLIISQNGDYFVRVRSWSDLPELGGLSSAWSNVGSFQVNLVNPPAVPALSDPGGINTGARFNLTWTDESDSGAALYEIHESLSPDFWPLTDMFFPASTVQEIVPVASGIYYYRVRSLTNPVELGGLVSDWSNIENIEVATNPMPIPFLYDLGGSDDDGVYTVTWSITNSPSVALYELQEARSSDFTQDLVYRFPRVSFEEIKQSVDGTYYYRVRSLSDLPERGGRSSAWSNVVQVDVSVRVVNPPNVPVLTDPGDLSTTGTVSLSWSDESISGASYYFLERSGSTNFTSPTSYIFERAGGDVLILQNGTWYFRVRAVALAGGLSFPSGFSNVADIVVNIDTSVLGLPIVNPFQSPTNQLNITLTGSVPSHLRKGNLIRVVSANQTVYEALFSNSWIIGVPLSEEGINTFAVKQVVSTTQEESGSASIDIVRDITAPMLLGIQPTDDSTVTRLPVLVTVTSDEANAQVFVMGEAAFRTAPATYAAVLRSLNEGPNLLTVELKDNVGNVNVVNYSLNFVPDALPTRYTLLHLSEIVEDPADLPIVGEIVDLTMQLLLEGEPVPGETINFTVTGGNGILNANSAITNTEGKAVVAFTTDTDSSVENLIEATAPNVEGPPTTSISVLTQPGPTDAIVKLTDETTRYQAGADVELRFRVEDSFGNQIPEVDVVASIIGGGGSLNATLLKTNGAGEGNVTLHTEPDRSSTYLIFFSTLGDSQVFITMVINVEFNPNGVTAQMVLDRVVQNDAKVADSITEITVSSDAEFLPALAQYRVWQKGDLQKVEELSPGSGVSVRPLPETVPGGADQFGRTILQHDAQNNIYRVRIQHVDETQSYRELDIDWDKGVILKEVERFTTPFATHRIELQYNNFAQYPEANNAWLFGEKIERSFTDDQVEHTTTVTIVNRQLNVGLTDGDFPQP